MAEGWICVDGNEAAARIAHELSEIVAIYPITERTVPHEAEPPSDGSPKSRRAGDSRQPE